MNAADSARVRVEFMPGRVAEVPPLEVAGVPKYVICRLAKQANGTYAMVPQTWHQMVRMTKKLHMELGLPCSYKTIYRLVKAGFVKGCLLTTNTLLLDLASLAEHLEKCEVSPEKKPFWTREREERFRWASSRVNGEPDEDEEDES